MTDKIKKPTEKQIQASRINFYKKRWLLAQREDDTWQLGYYYDPADFASHVYLKKSFANIAEFKQWLKAQHRATAVVYTLYMGDDAKPTDKITNYGKAHLDPRVWRVVADSIEHAYSLWYAGEWFRADEAFGIIEIKDGNGVVTRFDKTEANNFGSTHYKAFRGFAAN